MLSKHFSLEEMTRTNTGLTNTAPTAIILRLAMLCSDIMEPIRNEWGAIQVNCGYRSYAVNEKVGGVPTSQHVTGDACDFVPLNADIDIVYDWIVKESGLKWGQCIRETRGNSHWIHISLPRPSPHKNQEALITLDGGKTYQSYE